MIHTCTLDDIERPADGARDPERTRHVVGRPARDIAEPHLARADALQDVVEGAVSAGEEDHVELSGALADAAFQIFRARSGGDLGVIEKRGSWFSFDGEQLAQGREQAKAVIGEKSDLEARILAKIREKLAERRAAASPNAVSPNAAPEKKAVPEAPAAPAAK